MNALRRWALPLAVIVFLCLTSCSGGSSSDDMVAVAESIYDPGAAVGASGFNEAGGIRLSVLNNNGESVSIHDGDFIEPGLNTLSIEVGSDPSTIDRVFVSDGGGYQVEALPRGDGRYECTFNVGSDTLYQTLLVQVIHRSTRASKEKIVLRTYHPTPDDGYVKNGVGLLVAREILEDQEDEIADFLDMRIKDVFAYIAEERPSLITSLRYGDSDPSTKDIVITSLEPVSSGAYPGAVLHVSFTVRNVSLIALPLYGQNLVATQANDLNVDTWLSIGNTSQASPHLVLDFLGSAHAAFARPFFLGSAVENMIASQITHLKLHPLALDLAGGKDFLKESLPDHLAINGSDVNVDALLDRLELDLDKYLFVDPYGVPEETTSGMLAMGLGLFVEEYDDILWESGPGSAPPAQSDMGEVFNTLCESALNSVFDAMRRKYQGYLTELSYGDGNPATADFVINSLALSDSGAANVKYAQVSFTVKGVDLKAVNLLGFDLISTSDNDLAIDARLSIEDQGTGSANRIVLDVQSVSDARFAGNFDLDALKLKKKAVEGMIKKDMENMDPVSFSTNAVIEDLGMNLDVSNAFSLEDRYPAFPALTPYFQSPGWDLGPANPYTVRIAVSQNDVNRLLEDLLDQESGWDARELITAVLGRDFPGFDPSRSENEETIVRLSVPPLVDMRTTGIRLLIPDVILQYRISGIPQWEASIDLDLDINPVVRNSKLNFFVTPVEGRNHFHIMRDNRGNLGLLDHSSLVYDVMKGLPKMLGGTDGGPLLSLDLDSWQPTVVLKPGEDPVRISAAGGYLSIDLAASSLDLAKYIDFGVN